MYIVSCVAHVANFTRCWNGLQSRTLFCYIKFPLNCKSNCKIACGHTRFLRQQHQQIPGPTSWSRVLCMLIYDFSVWVCCVWVVRNVFLCVCVHLRHEHARNARRTCCKVMPCVLVRVCVWYALCSESTMRAMLAGASLPSVVVRCRRVRIQWLITITHFGACAFATPQNAAGICVWWKLHADH